MLWTKWSYGTILYVFHTNFEQILYSNKKYKRYSICYQQPLIDLTIPHLFYANKLMQKHNENMFINTSGPTFIFKTMDINHLTCPPFYKLLDDISKIEGLHSIIHIKKDMLIEWCVHNYTTFDGLVNELMTHLKHQQRIKTKT